MKKSSSIIIAVAIIIGFTILGLFLRVALEDDSKGINHEDRYELVPVNDNNMVIFDKKSGDYWNKFIPSEEGPTDWKKGYSPIKHSDH
ncbi:hypothetical protein ACQKL5_07565 [Peribacillus sp. NPDC097675]|uniref:hypothetical protein n=1 Tax=Peribacillus sp. NPDC097675 TaxID=3390618 RepID=UPI003D076FE0